MEKEKLFEGKFLESEKEKRIIQVELDQFKEQVKNSELPEKVFCCEN